MAIHQRLKNWFRQKSRSRKNGQEETVAVPEVHTGKVRHEAADSTPEADCPFFALFPPQQKHPLQSVRADRRGCLAF